MKPKHSKYGILSFGAFLTILAICLPTRATPSVEVSWVGNTWEAPGTSTQHMQYQINGLCVDERSGAPNGTVYCNSFYDEAGQECGVYQSGNYIGLLGDLGAYNRGGGYGIVTDGANYIFITMSQGGRYSPGATNSRGQLSYPAQVYTNNNNAYGSGVSAITFAAAVPANIVVGSVYSSGTGIPSGTEVTVISTDRKTLTLSKSTTAAGAANQSLLYMSTLANQAYLQGTGTITFTGTTTPPGIVVGSYFTGGTGISSATKVTGISGNTVTLSGTTSAAGIAGQLLTFNESWYCIRRYNLTPSGTMYPTAPVTTGTSANGWDATMAVVSTVYDVGGLAYGNGKLYASDTFNNRICVYNPSDLSLSGTFNFSNPGAIAVDTSGNLWIVQSGTSVVKVDSNGNNLNTVTASMLNNGNPVSVCIDHSTGSDRLMVADDGPDQQVKIFSNLTTNPPTAAGTVGTVKGFDSGTKGVVGDLKFEGLSGVSTDTTGNVYVGMNEFDDYHNMNLGGAELKSLNSAGTSLNWKLYSLQFENIADFDPTKDGAEIQSAEGHYKMDYTQAAGSQWTYYGYTLDPFAYPGDSRYNDDPTSVMLRWVNGKKIQYMVDQGSGSVYIFRFSGEQAVPSGLLARNHISGVLDDPTWPPNEPATGAWSWRDSDAGANGNIDADELFDTSASNDPTSWGQWVDHRGDIWIGYTGTSGILHYSFQGFDSNSNPIYNKAHSTLFTGIGTLPLVTNGVSDTFTDVERIQYDFETDTMYITGYSTNHPNNGQWGVLGTVLARYDNWSGTPSLTCSILLPWNTTANPPVFAKSFTVAGEKIFVGDVKTATIGVYDAVNGGSVLQTLTPAGTSSQLDAVVSLNSTETSKGQYLVLANENLHGKNYLYQVGGGLTPTTYNAYDPSPTNTFAGSATHNTIAATFLSNAGSVTMNFVNIATTGKYQFRITGFNGDNAVRTIWVSVDGGTPTQLHCPGTNSWSTSVPLWMSEVSLAAGNHTVKFYGNGANAPDIGQLEVFPSQ